MPTTPVRGGTGIEKTVFELADTIVVTAPTEGTITNTASVTSTTTDPDPANNSAEQSTMVLPDGADVFLIKTGNPSRLVAGAELTYQLSVGNRGPAQASGVLVTDMLPADVTPLSVTTSAGTCSGSSPIVCDIGTLARDAIATVEVRVRTHSPGTLTNTASVVAAEDDADLSNNTDTESTIVDPPGDLSITKSGPSTVTAGGVANYVIEVINGGNVAIDGASVRDVFPPHLAHKRWTCAATPGSSCGRTSGSGNINLKVDLAPGGVATFAVETKVVPGAQGSITNTATVEVPAGVADPNLANNTASTTAVVTGQ